METASIPFWQVFNAPFKYSVTPKCIRKTITSFSQPMYYFLQRDMMNKQNLFMSRNNLQRLWNSESPLQQHLTYNLQILLER